MPKITYRAQTSDDPTFTRVGPYRFEHGTAVEVDDATAERLSRNPWFTGGRAAKQEAVARVAGQGLSPGPDSGIDSSVMPATAPGSGMKHNPDTVMTEAGMVPAEDADTDETVGRYEIKHKGRGVFDVLLGDDTVQSGLSKAEAEDWVRARSV